MSPARWVCAIYSDFSGSVGIMRKRGVFGAGWGEIRDPPARGRLRRAIGKSRDHPPNLRNPHRATARWVCAIYSDSHRSCRSAARTGRTWYGGGCPKYATPLPRSVADFIGPSGNREIPSRPSETSTGPPSAGFAPFTRISREYVGIMRKLGLFGAAGRNARPRRIRGRLRRIFRKSRDFSENLRN